MPYRKVRPQKYEKAPRNAAICEYRKAHPEVTLKDVGLIFGTTEARTWQIIKRGSR